jgi:transposase
LLQGAAAHGFTGELWTVARISKLIDREFGIAYHPSHVRWLLRHRLGWSPQRPIRQAKERDQATVQRWVEEDWPRIKQTVGVWVCGPGGSLSGSGAGIAA